MRKGLAFFLSLLLLCGCTGNPGVPGADAPSSIPPQPALSTQPPGETREIPFSDPGSCRLDDSSEGSWIRYVTSRDQLPEQAALAGYDDAFFRDNALVVLCITLSSGSIRPRIGQILCTDNVAQVRIVRETEGEQLTQDMAVWLLWARVDRDLQCGFRLEEAFLPQGAEKY